jgi:predicted amino acid racemase
MNVSDIVTPRIEIDLEKIAHNAKTLKKLYGSKGISITGVTKVVCGDPKIADVLVKSGISILADSRIDNIRKMRKAGIQAQFLLQRTPIPSQTELVVRYADVSLNTELSVIKGLSRSAVKQGITHKIILMVELGDLREGLLPSDLENTVKEIIVLKGIEFVGVGTNLACFGGIEPDEEKMEYLSTIVKNIEEKFGLTLEFVSGGNSANYNWFISTKDIGKINNLRLGESIFLGCETLYRKHIPNLFTDAFTLITEVIESKIKPSVPYGNIHQDAFGNTPKFQDRGQIKRAILGVGLQDVLVSGLTPMLDIDILGASSDHIIVDAKQIELNVGNGVSFNLNYGALLSSMTSPYVIKKYK